MVNIAKLEREKLEYESKMTTEEQEYTGRRNSWISKVQELVEKISCEFHTNMTYLGFNGQVELRKTENEAKGIENSAYEEKGEKEIEETDFDEIEVKARIKPKSGSKVDNIEKAILLGKFSKKRH